jgi:hypothetical protein
MRQRQMEPDDTTKTCPLTRAVRFCDLSSPLDVPFTSHRRFFMLSAWFVSITWVLTVVAIYYWWVRKPQAEAQAAPRQPMP